MNAPGSARSAMDLPCTNPPVMPARTLNSHTLLFSASLLGFVTAAMTSSLARASGTVRQAATAWSGAMCCMGITLLSAYLRGSIPEHVALTLLNAAAMAFALLALLAYARLFSLRYSAGAIGMVYVAQLLGIFGFQLMGTPREVVVLTLNSFITAELLWVALLIVRHGRDTSAPLRWVATTTIACFACLSTARIVMTLLGDSPAIDPSAQSNVQIVTLLGTSVAIIGSTIAFVLMVHDRQYREALESARRDSLTGVLARRAFFDELAALERQPGLAFSLVMVDIDHFKAINDRYGHLGGDAVLAHVGGLLHDTTRSQDAAGRYGGEEFCVLLRRCGEDEAAGFASRLIEMAAGATVRMPDGREVAFTVSAGYAGGHVAGAGTADAPSVREVLARADNALYEAKRAGRNRAMGARGDAPDASNSVLTLSRDVMAV